MVLVMKNIADAVDYRNGYSDGFYNNLKTPPNIQTCPISYHEYMVGYAYGKSEAKRVHEANKNGTPTGN